MKASHINDNAGRETPSKQFVCWNKDAQAQMLRVELVDGSFFLFPNDHLNVVRFERHNEGDLITLFFHTHEIKIAGKHLRALGLAFQRFAVDWVKELPARYAATANHDSVYIVSIKVSEIHAEQ
jgi:hypothetical protein